MEPSVTCGHAQRARVRGVSQFRRRRRSGGGTRGTQGSRAGAAGKPPARRVAVRLLVAQDPRKAPLRFACAAVVCSLSGRRCRAPVSGRVAGRARHCRATAPGRGWATAGHYRRPSGPLPWVVAGGGSGEDEPGATAGPQAEVTARVACVVTSSPRDGLSGAARMRAR